MRSIPGLGMVFLLGCTHQRVVTPTYSPQVATRVKQGSICSSGQVIGVSAVNKSPQGNTAGITEAGIHTFQYRFASDPALQLKRGLEETLQAGGCRIGTPSTAALTIGILRIEAKGLACGFATCEGTGTSIVQATLSDAGGRPVYQKLITSTATKGCGMIICNEREASQIASQILSDTITKTIDAFGYAIATQLAAGPKS